MAKSRKTRHRSARRIALRPGMLVAALGAVLLAGGLGLWIGSSSAHEAPPAAPAASFELAPPPAPFAAADVAVLSERLASALADVGRRTRASVHVVDPATGQSLFDRDGAEDLVPASTQKLVTAAVAYDVLGPDWTFTTTFRARGGYAEGVVASDLVVRGTGDPTLSDRFFDSPEAAMGFIADNLVRQGLKEVRGRLLADDSYFDGPRRGPNWPRDSYVQPWMVDVTPLVFNDDQVRVVSRPVGAGAEVVLQPDVGYGRVTSRLDLTDRRDEHAVAILRDDAAPDYTVRGKLFTGLPLHAHDVNVADGSLWYLHALQHALESRGIPVRGGPPARLDPDDADPDAGTTLLVYRSTLERSAAPMLKFSQNLYAELMFRVIGAERAGEGSFSAASRAVTTWLLEHGLLESGTVIADGSGLSRDDRLSARQLTAILAHVARDEELFPRLRSALAEPGAAGTLRSRMPELAGSVHAKTGTLNGVSSLAGYVRSGGGRWLAFAALFNDCDKGAARACQDRICAILAELSAQP